MKIAKKKTKKFYNLFYIKIIDFIFSMEKQ